MCYSTLLGKPCTLYRAEYIPPPYTPIYALFLADFAPWTLKLWGPHSSSILKNKSLYNQENTTLKNKLKSKERVYAVPSDNIITTDEALKDFLFFFFKSLKNNQPVSHLVCLPLVNSPGKVNFYMRASKWLSKGLKEVINSGSLGSPVGNLWPF